MAESMVGSMGSDSRSDASEQLDAMAEDSGLNQGAAPTGSLTTNALLAREQQTGPHIRRHITDLKGTIVGVAKLENPRDLSFRGDCKVGDLLNTSPYYSRHATAQEEMETGKWYVLLQEFQPTHLVAGDTIAAPHERLAELGDPLVLIVSKQDSVEPEQRNQVTHGHA